MSFNNQTPNLGTNVTAVTIVNMPNIAVRDGDIFPDPRVEVDFLMGNILITC